MIQNEFQVRYNAFSMNVKSERQMLNTTSAKKVKKILFLFIF